MTFDIDILAILIFIIPAYFANALPVISKGKFPIDFNLNFIDGRRWLGDGKTYKGLLYGLIGGVIIAIIIYLITNVWSYLIIGILASIGAMVGDILGSFIKRRVNLNRGESSLLMDQLLFIIIALLFAYTEIEMSLPKLLNYENIAIILILTYLMHRGSNILANKLGLKKVPW